MKTKFLGKKNKNLKKSGKALLDSIERIKEDINIGVKCIKSDLFFLR